VDHRGAFGEGCEGATNARPGVRMKAALCNRYGPPEVIQIAEVDKPVPSDHEVLIRVRAASVNPLDLGSIKGRPYMVRLMTGLRKPKNNRPGVDVSGRVEAVGENVNQFRPGDDVLGVCINDPQARGVEVWNHRQGAFAEYVCAPESTLVLKPKNISFEQAASIPVAAFTSLQGLRDKGHVQAGYQVLINGAAGGVGTFAVQIAKSFGAEVSGVCSSGNTDMVRSIGADQVIDYTREDFTKGGQRYDLIFDCVGNHSLSGLRSALKPRGKLIMVGELTGRGIVGIMGRLIAAFMVSWFSDRKLVLCFARPNKEDLATVRDLVAAGKVKPVIDRCYALHEVAEAIRYLERKHARGKVVIVLEEIPKP
jgi:NADPH:quinone reductase-like Zn-dependent oxidoreductase